MNPKILIVIMAISSTGYSAPNLYQVRSVHHPEVQEAGDFNSAVASTLNILPELTAAFNRISSRDGGSFPSDPSSIFEIISSFMPLTKQSVLESDAVRGNPTSQAEVERIESIGKIIPVVSAFVESMRSLSGNVGTSSTDQLRQSNSPTGELQLETRSDDAVLEAVLELLPDISNIFQQINNDPGRSDPSDSEFANRVVMAFLPLSEKALKATAKAEGRPVRKEETDQLKRIDTVMPAITQFMNSLRTSNFIDFKDRPTASRFDQPKPATFKQPANSKQPLFPNQSPSSSLRTSSLNLPSISETPAPATFNQPPVPDQTIQSVKPASAISTHFSYPAVSYILKTPEASSTPLRSPSFPEATHFAPQVYEAVIPTVPHTISGGPAYYSYSTLYGR